MIGTEFSAALFHESSSALKTTGYTPDFQIGSSLKKTAPIGRTVISGQVVHVAFYPQLESWTVVTTGGCCWVSSSWVSANKPSVGGHFSMNDFGEIEYTNPISEVAQ